LYSTTRSNLSIIVGIICNIDVFTAYIMEVIDMTKREKVVNILALGGVLVWLIHAAYRVGYAIEEIVNEENID